MRKKPSSDADAEEWSAADVEAVAVRLLARREHSRFELSRKLAARDAPAELVESVLDELAERRLQSDERYAESLVAARISRGQGPVRIRRDLEQHGVATASIEAAFEVANPDWDQLARETRVRRFGEAPPADWNARARQSRFLEYRGFTGEQIRIAMGIGPIF